MKNSKVKGFLASLLCLTLALPMVVGVKTVAAEEGADYQTTYGDKMFDNATVTVAIYDGANAPDGQSATDNRWTDYVKEQMGEVGINIEFVAIPKSDANTKIQTMLATDSAPDIIFSYDTLMMKDYFEDGGIVNLSPYVDGDDQARNLKALMGAEHLDGGRDEEGNLFAVMGKKYEENIIGFMNMNIRKDWLDELGMAVPTTVDELFDVLMAFKENYPDSIPYCTNQVYPNFNCIAYAFSEAALDENRWLATKFAPAYKDAGMIEYYRFMNKMFNAGLMDKEYYTNTEGQGTNRMFEFVLQGKVGLFQSDKGADLSAAKGQILQTLKQTNPEIEYVSIPNFKNVNDGEIYTMADVPYGFRIAITKTCENVEAAVTYLDWLSTNEGGYVLFNGFEGEHYEIVDNAIKVIDAEYNATDKDWNKHNINIISNNGFFLEGQDIVKSKAFEYEEDWVAHFESEMINTATGIGRLLGTPSDFTPVSLAEYGTDLQLVNDEYEVKLITCPAEEFDSLAEEFLEALEENGAEEVYQEYCEWYGIAAE